MEKSLSFDVVEKKKLWGGIEDRNHRSLHLVTKLNQLLHRTWCKERESDGDAKGKNNSSIFS